MKIILFALMTITGAQATGPEFGYDRPGSDYRNFELRRPNYSSCNAACRRDPTCRAWTYVKPGVQGTYARCWLKNAVPAKVPSACCTSGTKY